MEEVIICEFCHCTFPFKETIDSIPVCLNCWYDDSALSDELADRVLDTAAVLGQVALLRKRYGQCEL